MLMKKKDSLVQLSIVSALLCLVLGLVYGPLKAREEAEKRKNAESRSLEESVVLRPQFLWFLNYEKPGSPPVVSPPK
jgi:hypothetical protein